MNKRFTWPVTPVAAKENIVIFGTLRFTVLTEQLIRIEQDPQGIFEDRASQSVFHREFAPVQFSVVREPELVLETAKLRLTCGGTLESLCITLKCVPGTSWHYGDPFETLGGTVSTLDTFAQYTSAEYGLYVENMFAPSVDRSTRSARMPGLSMPISFSACSAFAPPRVASATISLAGNRLRSRFSFLWKLANRRI